MTKDIYVDVVFQGTIWEGSKKVGEEYDVRVEILLPIDALDGSYVANIRTGAIPHVPIGIVSLVRPLIDLPGVEQIRVRGDELKIIFQPYINPFALMGEISGTVTEYVKRGGQMR